MISRHHVDHGDVPNQGIEPRASNLSGWRSTNELDGVVVKVCFLPRDLQRTGLCQSVAPTGFEPAAPGSGNRCSFR